MNKQLVIKRFEGALPQSFDYLSKMSSFSELIKNKFPLEAIQLSQHISQYSGVSHALASSLAIENSLKSQSSASGQKIRYLVWMFSMLHSHVQHFYYDLFPDYINSNHLKYFNPYWLQKGKSKSKGDLSTKTARNIIKNVPTAQKVLEELVKIISYFTGKYPIVMNFIPGGVTNTKISQKTLLQVFSSLEKIKEFIEKTWPYDVKQFIKESEYDLNYSEESQNYISFGSPLVNKNGRSDRFYSPGVLIDGKLEPLNENKISTFSPQSILKKEHPKLSFVSPHGVHYDTEIMHTGALSRIMVTHYAGVNPKLSETLATILDELHLTEKNTNQFSSRLLAEVYEGRFFIKEIFNVLLEIDLKTKLTEDIKFDFVGKKSGTGLIESPSGALLHKISIENNTVQNYQIITATNWNLSPKDDVGKEGAALNEIHKKKLSLLAIERIMHSYYVQPYEAYYA